MYFTQGQLQVRDIERLPTKEECALILAEIEAEEGGDFNYELRMLASVK